MKTRSSLAKHCFVYALLAVSACTKTLTIDDGQGALGAAGEGAGTGAGEHSAGRAGRAGGTGAAGAGAAGDDGAAGAAGKDGATGGGGEGGQTGADDDGFGGRGDDGPLATTRWTGNEPGCPATPPDNEQACEAEEGLTCAYYYDQPGAPAQTNYSECACRAFCGGDMKWDCYRNTGGGVSECPATQPEQGSGCFGFKGVECYYPATVTCSCPREGADPQWRCGQEAPPAVAHPSVIDEDKIVGELTAAERAAWCAWYAPVEPGFPQPRLLPANEDGYYPYTGCATGTSLGCNYTLPMGLPARACEANLALSSCAATVFELNDCVLSLRNQTPSPFGCARYLDSPGCSGTLVNGVGEVPSVASAALPGNDSCLVKVE